MKRNHLFRTNLKRKIMIHDLVYDPFAGSGSFFTPSIILQSFPATLPQPIPQTKDFYFSKNG